MGALDNALDGMLAGLGGAGRWGPGKQNVLGLELPGDMPAGFPAAAALPQRRFINGGGVTSAATIGGWWLASDSDHGIRSKVYRVALRGRQPRTGGHCRGE